MLVFIPDLNLCNFHWNKPVLDHFNGSYKSYKNKDEYNIVNLTVNLQKTSCRAQSEL